MSGRGRPSAKAKDKEDAKALGVNRVPENQKREVYERVRRAIEAKPGVCINHKVGSSAWDKNEQRVLEDGLRYYPHEQHSNMLIYIRIAASLPKKTVRDVAHHLRHMQDTHRAKVEASAGMNPAKRHHPDPGAAAAMAAMHEHQMAAMFAANAAAGMAAMHTLPGLAQGLAGPNGPGPHLKDEKVEARVCALVQENMALINSIRENMVMGRFFDNHPLMIAFDKNVKEVTALLATLPFADMQKLPVQINPYFITGSAPPGMGAAQPGSPGHHLHPPHGEAPPPPGPAGGGIAGHVNGNGNAHNGHNNTQPPVNGVDQPVAATAAAPPAMAGAAPAAGGAPIPVPQPAPPAQQHQHQQQQQQQPPKFAAAPPVPTQAPQDPQHQQLQQQQPPVEAAVPNAAEVMAAAKEAASAAALVIASTPPGDPASVAAAAVAAATQPALAGDVASAAAAPTAPTTTITTTAPIAELPGEAGGGVGVGVGGGGANGDGIGRNGPFPDPSGVAPPQA